MDVRAVSNNFAKSRKNTASFLVSGKSFSFWMVSGKNMSCIIADCRIRMPKLILMQVRSYVFMNEVEEELFDYFRSVTQVAFALWLKLNLYRI